MNHMKKGIHKQIVMNEIAKLPHVTIDVSESDSDDEKDIKQSNLSANEISTSDATGTKKIKMKMGKDEAAKKITRFIRRANSLKHLKQAIKKAQDRQAKHFIYAGWTLMGLVGAMTAIMDDIMKRRVFVLYIHNFYGLAYFP